MPGAAPHMDVLPRGEGPLLVGIPLLPWGIGEGGGPDHLGKVMAEVMAKTPGDQAQLGRLMAQKSTERRRNGATYRRKYAQDGHRRREKQSMVTEEGNA